MRVSRFVPLIVLVCSFPGITAAQEDTKRAAAAQQPAADVSAAKSKIVYVSDFELDVLNVNGKEEKSAPASTPAAPAPQGDAKKEEVAAEQASKLVELMSITLVKELEKAGYTAQRLKPGESRPAEGIGVRGVFAEPDEQNRLRRAVIGNAVVSVGGKMALFVGVSNLARPDQALYAVADPKGGDKAGPVITVSSYSPVAKFQLDKNATEKAVKDTASTIAADLTLLLNANVAAITH
jgi:hypothetical protein